MAHDSHPGFRVHHGLRIKGFVKVENLAELAGLPEEEVLTHLQAMQEEGHTNYREARGLWQLTPDGHEAYVVATWRRTSASQGFREGLAEKYHRFLVMNESFKALCADWQLRNGEPNDHSDGAYDEECIKRLGPSRRRGAADLPLVRRGGEADQQLRGTPSRQQPGKRER